MGIIGDWLLKKAVEQDLRKAWNDFVNRMQDTEAQCCGDCAACPGYAECWKEFCRQQHIPVEGEEDKTQVEREAEEIVKALRCSSLPGGVNCMEVCRSCKYCKRYIGKGEYAAIKAERDGYVYDCDCDRIALDAAEMIERLMKKE